MDLPARDRKVLDASGLDYTVVEDQGMLAVRIRAYPLPPGLSATSTEVMFRLAPGYPDVPPDMWWLQPGVTTSAGGIIQATEQVEMHFGLQWQRWSRHIPPESWHSGVDGLKSFLKLLDAQLALAAGAAA